MSVLGRNVREDRSVFTGGGQTARSGEALRTEATAARLAGVELIVSWRLVSGGGAISTPRVLEWRIGGRWAQAVVVECAVAGGGGVERVVVSRATVSRAEVEGLTHITVAEGHDAAALLTVVLDGASVLYGRTSLLTTLGVIGGGAEGPTVRVMERSAAAT
jgi:hypothetical protein